MEATRAAALTISREKFTSFVSALIDHNPDPNGDPQPPGPWDPVIRLTFEKFGPHPEPWRTRFESVALNPQPLPPRWAFAIEFVRLAADRLLMIQETADAINSGDERGIIVVGGKVSELVDFVCGNVPRRFPTPPPRGSNDDSRLSGQELILMGAELLNYSRTIANESLGQEFTAAGERLIDVGLERL
jgi:hypothetical protein